MAGEKRYILENEFVETIPKELEEGILYVSMKYGTAIHLCACGCGVKTVTPFDAATGWVITYDGEVVTLRPSMKQTFECKSHYNLTGGKIKWHRR